MKFIRLYFIIQIALLSLFSNAQTKSELEKQKKTFLTELKKNTNLYDKIRSQKKDNLMTLNLISNKINSHQELINDIDDEINHLNRRIEVTELNIGRTMGVEAEVKNELKQVIYHTYKSRNNNVLMLILSSGNLNTAYRRIQYFQDINSSYNNHIRNLKKIENQLSAEVNELNQKKAEKLRLANKKTNELALMKKEKDEKETILKNLSKREKELLKLIDDQRRIEKELEKKIRELAEKELKSSNSIYSKLTPAEKQLSKNFVNNKGKLPWPTIKGEVTSSFGKHEHPVLKGVFINNNGIDITTVDNSSVRAIFDGVVTKVFSIKGCNFVVIVRHGNFLSLYSNLSDVFIKNGQTVKTKQNIGTISSEDKNEISTLHFEIWEELKKHDPMQWLSN